MNKKQYRKKRTVLERLYKRTKIPINKDGTNNTSKCWDWIGPVNNAGYGLMRGPLGMATVHRVSYVEHVKTINYSSMKQVLHKCGNKLCVNPDHLMTGDNKDRAQLQRQHDAYNYITFNDKKKMWPTCKYCGETTYLPHFKRIHSLCARNAKHKYITDNLSGNTLNEN